MKKKYVKPTLEVTEFRFAENIATSGSCEEMYSYWGQDCTPLLPTGQWNQAQQ